MSSEVVDEILKTTRSVRRRLDFERAVEPSVLEECIDVATQAPTGLQRESWRFLVLTEPGPKRAVGELYSKAFDAMVAAFRELPELRDLPEPPALNPGYRSLADRMHEMPALILVCSEGEPPQADAALQVAYYASILPAAWSLMVALRARGLGSTWTTLLLRERDAVADALGIPEGVTQTVLLPVAYTKGARLRPAARKPAAEVTYWNSWGRRRQGG